MYEFLLSTKRFANYSLKNFFKRMNSQFSGGISHIFSMISMSYQLPNQIGSSQNLRPTLDYICLE
jgi:hypothetical protein